MKPLGVGPLPSSTAPGPHPWLLRASGPLRERRGRLDWAGCRRGGGRATSTPVLSELAARRALEMSFFPAPGSSCGDEGSPALLSCAAWACGEVGGLGSGARTVLFFCTRVTLRKALINPICLSSLICKAGVKLSRSEESS